MNKITCIEPVLRHQLSKRPERLGVSTQQVCLVTQTQSVIKLHIIQAMQVEFKWQNNIHGTSCSCSEARDGTRADTQQAAHHRPMLFGLHTHTTNQRA